LEKLYNYFVFSIATVFFGYVAVRMVFPLLKSKLNPLKGFTAIAVLVVSFLVLWGVDRFIVRVMDYKTAKSAVIFLIAINVMLQLLCLNELKVKPSWDFGAIMTASDDIATGRLIRNWGYFQEYPYNLNTAVFVGIFKFILGGNQWAPYILNIIAVTLSITGVCLLANRLYGQRASVLTAFFCIAATPLYLYIPIVYTDTLSMPFAIWTVYVWSFIKPYPISTGKIPMVHFCILIGLLSAVGYLIKPVAAIGLAAFIMDYILNRNKYISVAFRSKKLVMKIVSKMLPLAAAFLTFVLVVSAFRFYIDTKGFDSRLDVNKSIPYTHWLMMGINAPATEGGTSYGYGGFSNEDLKYTRSYKTLQEKEQAEIVMIRNRLNQFGVEGYALFLLKKIEWTWTDGTYFAPVKLARYPEKLTALHKFVLFSNGKSNKLYLVFTQLVQAMMLSMIFVGCITLLRKNADDAFRLMSVMCLGLMLFLLFWETRSRYLVFLIPVFIVMTVYGMISAFRGADKISGYLHRKLKSLLTVK
jgi:hypothetical protein